ncbi:hypothetical protein PFICI_00972 [Pestalotiopsis fici W106-1]|uniref:AB hydrolase-1 domain-containing protein n=1 Tax=Pestalotiopsis fici (strain W106-1 / CGMCC3.15140) TaxID=1229662 RepID=W3XMC3_PESFW|nr:uncharacterized protein PFICI_00972 [Pestalotiopsis fici W106-1]ETS87144.1 hypothetical protein PFICI_00972 [Pestalotiopsis fici W106-1]
MSRPVVLIVPGAAALAELYKTFIKAVSEKGYEIEALTLPSVRNAAEANVTPPTMYEDAAAIQSRVAKLADAGKDVILLPHSYGGTPSTQSVEGLSKKEREAKGLPGGIIGLAYMTCLIPELGQPAMSVQASMAPEDKVPMEINEHGWIYFPSIPRLAELSFTDMPKEQGEYWAAKLANHSSASFASPLTYQGFKDVPVSYLVCEHDLTIPPVLQQAGIDMIERITGEKVEVTRIDSDHCAPASDMQKVVDWIVNVVNRFETA